MSDPRDEHESLVVDDGVHDPVVPRTDSKIVPSGELHGARRSWIGRKPVDRFFDPLTHPPAEPAERSRRLWVEPDLVHEGYRSRARTSAHGTASSRSSRAFKAARLSSR